MNEPEDLLHIRPAPGALLRDPLTRQPLPASGARVPRTSFWLRRLEDGSAQLVKDEQPSAERAPGATETPRAAPRGKK